jgi:hypothetical protein
LRSLGLAARINALAVNTGFQTRRQYPAMCVTNKHLTVSSPIWPL